MAYFTWKGINLEGKIHKGKLFATSHTELDALLLKQEIALISYSQVKQISFVGRSISADHKIQFFRQLSELLSAGVLLPDALLVISSQTHHAKFHSYLSDVAACVHEGNSLSQALSKYPFVFDSIMVHMIHVGEESGRLVVALALLCEYLTMVHDFRYQIRSAAMVPMITFSFFCLIGMLIFIFIIPHFVSMFQSVQQQLPYVTHLMIKMSDFMRSPYLCIALGIGCAGVIAFRSYLRTERGAILWDSLCLRVPYIGMLIQESSLAYFLQALAMLGGGGVSIVPALAIAKEMIRNKVIKQHIHLVERDVAAGGSLSQAMMHDPGQIFGAQAIAIIKVGEESGRLVPLLGRAALMYQDKVKRKIAILTRMINPLLMVVLGLLITLLIFAVYLPVFNLSNIM